MRRHGQVLGQRAALSLKQSFPKYSALRADFSDRFLRAVAENTRMLLNALARPDTVPVVIEAALRAVWDAKDEALSARLPTAGVRVSEVMLYFQPARQSELTGGETDLLVHDVSG